MSRLNSRLRRLEDRLGGCPACARRPVVSVTEYVRDDGPSHVRAHGDSSPCPDCGQPPQIVTICLAFDPFANDDHDPDTPWPGSVRWEREQQCRAKSER